MPTAEAICRWELEPNPTPQAWVSQSEDVLCPEDNPELQAEIKRAKELLVLEQDDDNPIYSADTLDRAIGFLDVHANKLYKMDRIYLPVPDIGPGPNGSIDLHWKRTDWELLVNIPSDANQLAGFYGDNYGAQKIRGTIDPKTPNLGIIAWLIK